MVTIPLVKKDSVTNRAYKFEENPFTEVYIDVNYKCNMACPMCYSDTPLGAQATVPDLDLDYYEEFLHQAHHIKLDYNRHCNHH